VRALETARVESPTEGRNPRTTEIDVVSTIDMLRLLNAEDRMVPDAVAAVLPALAMVVDIAADRLSSGGRMHYFGAGTSGRIAVMDAAEVIPTFGVAPGIVVAHHAGGAGALERPIENVEDSIGLGERDAAAVTGQDVVVALAASGRTPYAEGALRAGRAVGAFTVLVSSNPVASLAPLADVHIAVDTGPEAIAGSTRLKAATAQKMVLNCLSTAVMVRCGRTYSNLMVEVAATNAKLRGRLLTILAAATGADADKCEEALAASDGELKTAIVCLLTGATPAGARQALQSAEGHTRAAVGTLAVDRVVVE
jgi:N-acetylmuramic acid 6-phosphate etherase